MCWKSCKGVSHILDPCKGVSHILGSMQRISPKLEACASKERRLLQDQVQLCIGAKVQL